MKTVRVEMAVREGPGSVTAAGLARALEFKVSELRHMGGIEAVTVQVLDVYDPSQPIPPQAA